MTTATQTRFSEPEMDAAFKRVQNPDDWRAPIECLIEEADREQRELIAEAILFYTATAATIRFHGPTPGSDRQNVYRVIAPGYRAGPAGP